jgi:hypothetical protein
MYLCPGKIYEDKTSNKSSAEGEYKGAAWGVEEPAGLFQIGLGGFSGSDDGEYDLTVHQGRHPLSVIVYGQVDHRQGAASQPAT